MATLATTISTIHVWESLSLRNIWVNKLNPLIKLAVTIFFIVVVASYDKYEVVPLVTLFLYPLLLMVFADISFLLMYRKIKPVLLFIFFISFINIFFDSYGFIIFFNLFLRSLLCITSAFLFSATTNIFSLTHNLNALGLSNSFIMVINLFFRYILVLLEEAFSMLRAYRMRTMNDNNISYALSGPFLGELLLRTLNRSEKIYSAMSLRNPHSYNIDKDKIKLNRRDLLYFFSWILVLLLLRFLKIEEIMVFLF